MLLETERQSRDGSATLLPLPMTPPERATRRLDLSSPANRERFERAFYAGFEHITHNRIVRWLWDWDHDARRLRTRIPYSDQQIWSLHTADNDLWAAIAANTRLQQLQSAAFGFAVPPDLAEDARAGRVCEFLTIFAVGEKSLPRKLPLWREVFSDLRRDGFTHALATTAPKMLPLYRWIEGTVIGERQIDGETRLFLIFDLQRTRRHTLPTHSKSQSLP